MRKLIFYIVDVFCGKKLTGNQLAVFRVKDFISDYEMQKIASEMNFSETTFILSDDERGDGFDVRIFTPKEEVPFAGHPTLGTAYIIQKEIMKEKITKINLNLKVGPIPVSFNYKNNIIENLWMKQIQPIFGEVLFSKDLAPILSLRKEDIDSRYPIQEVSTGLPFIITPLTSLEAVKKCKIVSDLYFDYIKNRNAKAIFVFSPETYSDENHLNVRMFAEFYGIPEDPATGSANGCLAGYLIKHNYFDLSKIDIRIEQGYEINRPSIIYLKAEKFKDKININVGGNVSLVAKGDFYLD
jgi:trans-2,3-dihydro-3-hydroxyanthranilate isomerase